MATNAGKTFEDAIKKSCVKQGVKYLRIKDAPNQFSFGGEGQSNIRFTQSSPYDSEMYKYPNLIPCELKSTIGTSFSIPENEKDNKKMIKYRQIKGLNDVNIYKGSYPGFLFNFRKNNNTYFMSINSFNDFYKTTTKKSINESDITSYSDTILVNQTLKKVNYTYDIEKLFKEVSNGK